MQCTESALELFKNGFICSQAVLAGFSPRIGLDKDTAFKISTGFGGGCGSQGLCGAVAGAHMVLGMSQQLDENEPQKSRLEVYRRVKKFNALFKERNDTLFCLELLGLDPSTSEGSRKGVELNLFTTVCAGFVRDASEILELLLDGQSQDPDRG